MDRGYQLDEIAKVLNKRIPINEGTLNGCIYTRDRVDDSDFAAGRYPTVDVGTAATRPLMVIDALATALLSCL